MPITGPHKLCVECDLMADACIEPTEHRQYHTTCGGSHCHPSRDCIKCAEAPTILSDIVGLATSLESRARRVEWGDVFGSKAMGEKHPSTLRAAARRVLACDLPTLRRYATGQLKQEVSKVHTTQQLIASVRAS